MVPRLLAGMAALLVAVGMWVITVRRRFVVVTVRGSSMAPALGDGERVVVRRRPLSEVRSGDVVVFAGAHDLDGLPPDVRAAALAAAPDEWLIKRATAVPGDPVPRATVPALADVDDDIVPDGSLVVLGDNAMWSSDSRHFGYVSADRLLGVAVRKLGRHADLMALTSGTV